MNVKVIIVISIALLFSFIGSLYWSYSKGYDNAEQFYISKLKQLESDNTKNILAIERVNYEKQQMIVSEYIQLMETMKNAHDKELSALNVANVSDIVDRRVYDCESSSRVSAEDNNTETLRCYTEEQLLDKIKASMVIARECDELALKYNSLLKICK